MRKRTPPRTRRSMIECGARRAATKHRQENTALRQILTSPLLNTLLKEIQLSSSPDVTRLWWWAHQWLRLRSETLNHAGGQTNASPQL